ncbi:NifB/NifX family molybdenum-iron cluster-binding protein [Thermococcus sp.]|uniref:NifB/NifX family molybdenum-iron cluster-binding protein n=1 Tax=Thermococcus sp. TaxID=35749 RepID=UPI002618F9FE|nr:NifB/NifX family molybdenum-iron cluster-binding protein [Thermococcus sp.]
MRVAVPSDGGFDGKAVPLDMAGGIAIAEIGPDGVKEIKVIKPGENAAGELKREGVELVLTPEIPEELALKFTKLGIMVLTGVSGKVKEVIMLALKGTVKNAFKAGLGMAKMGRDVVTRKL